MEVAFPDPHKGTELYAHADQHDMFSRFPIFLTEFLIAKAFRQPERNYQLFEAN